MPNAKTEYSRALRAATVRRWEADRKALGYKRVFVTLSPAAAARLDELAAKEAPPSKSAALERLLAGGIDGGQPLTVTLGGEVSLPPPRPIRETSAEGPGDDDAA